MSSGVMKVLMIFDQQFSSVIWLRSLTYVTTEMGQYSNHGLWLATSIWLSSMMSIELSPEPNHRLWQHQYSLALWSEKHVFWLLWYFLSDLLGGWHRPSIYVHSLCIPGDTHHRYTQLPAVWTNNQSSSGPVKCYLADQNSMSSDLPAKHYIICQKCVESYTPAQQGTQSSVSTLLKTYRWISIIV